MSFMLYWNHSAWLTVQSQYKERKGGRKDRREERKKERKRGRKEGGKVKK